LSGASSTFLENLVLGGTTSRTAASNDQLDCAMLLDATPAASSSTFSEMLLDSTSADTFSDMVMDGTSADTFSDMVMDGTSAETFSDMVMDGTSAETFSHLVMDSTLTAASSSSLFSSASAIPMDLAEAEERPLRSLDSYANYKIPNRKQFCFLLFYLH